jgi:uncharacterized membrane protein
MWGTIPGVAVVLMSYQASAVTNPDGIRAFFEMVQYVWFALMAVHCLTTRSRSDLLALFGVALLYGIILENSGIWLGFYEELGYSMYLPGLPAPPATMLGWCTVFYLALWITDRLAPRLSWPAATLVATAVLLSLDIQLDPVATAVGWWTWPAEFSHRFLGVPLINFLAWASAGAPFYGAYFFVRSHKQRKESYLPQRLLVLLPLVLALAALMVIGLTWALLGFHAPEMNLFKGAFSAASGLLGN